MYSCTCISLTIGADITDYFNYGFTEETWRLYCEKQRKMRHEVTQMTKLVVRLATPPLLTKTRHYSIINNGLLIVIYIDIIVYSLILFSVLIISSCRKQERLVLGL